MTLRENDWRVYLLLCADGTFYCGATCGLRRRIAQHNAGSAAKYTRGRGPVKLIAKSRPMSRGAALSLEARVKKAKKALKASIVKSAR